MDISAVDFRKAGDLAYRVLRDAIISGKLEPGARLNQDELAKRLGVSRAPVRDALMRLESEGLVRTSAGKGLVVSTPTPEELTDIFALRDVLDGYSVRLACARIGPAELSRLETLVDETDRLTPAGDLEALVAAHAEFHCVIYAASGNAELERVARNLWDRSYRYRRMGLSNRSMAGVSAGMHRDILKALRRRDADLAVRLIGEENRMTMTRLLPNLPGAAPTAAGRG